MAVVNGIHNILIQQGSSFALRITLNEFDLDGLVVRAQLRERLDSNEGVEFGCLVEDPPTTGVIQLSLPPSVTQTLKPNIEAFRAADLIDTLDWPNYLEEISSELKKEYFMSGRSPYYWDLEVSSLDGNTVNRFLSGRVLITAEVTRIG
jgi:hypothetical protein